MEFAAVYVTSEFWPSVAVASVCPRLLLVKSEGVARPKLLFFFSAFSDSLDTQLICGLF